jgi:hypothetical protein
MNMVMRGKKQTLYFQNPVSQIGECFLILALLITFRPQLLPDFFTINIGAI